MARPVLKCVTDPGTKILNPFPGKLCNLLSRKGPHLSPNALLLLDSASNSCIYTSIVKEPFWTFPYSTLIRTGGGRGCSMASGVVCRGLCWTGANRKSTSIPRPDRKRRYYSAHRQPTSTRKHVQEQFHAVADTGTRASREK